LLELANLLQGEVIDDIGDGATAVLVTVVPGGFPPSLGLEPELLAQQREEDLRLLITESRKLLQPLEHFGATGVAPGPDRFGLTVVVVDDGRGQLLHPRCHRLGKRWTAGLAAKASRKSSGFISAISLTSSRPNRSASFAGPANALSMVTC